MLRDRCHRESRYRLSEKEHRYGQNVHLLDDAYLSTLLARAGSPETKQPELNRLVMMLYRQLAALSVNHTFPRRETAVTSRMAATHPEGRFAQALLDEETPVVCVNLARAGTLPSQVCYDAFNELLNPDRVRQDHIAIARKTDADSHVIGAELGGVKIGGPVDGAYVFIPDPMGATGSTVRTALDLYRTFGRPAKFLALHLIVTPEYLARVKREMPELEVYAVRLDRGLSAPDVLECVPGERWAEERGLNDKQYIVPGAGGLGEVLNNSFV
jgi:uracil phosphoribosyltransferase